MVRPGVFVIVIVMLITFFLPSQQALEQIPDMKLSAVGIQLAEVRIFCQTWG